MRRYVVSLALVFLCSAGATGSDLTAANTEADRVHSNGKTALMGAAKEGDNARIEALMKQGADVNRPNRNGGTPIMYAALSGSPETVALLLEHHARVNAVAENGWSALMIASVKGYDNVVRLLLEHGAEPNQADIYSWTPLMRAVYEQRDQSVRLLVNHPRTRVDQRGENGATALHLAVIRGDAGAVKLLLNAGADPHIEDNSGRTALDLARKQDNPHLLRIMNAGHRD